MASTTTFGSFPGVRVQTAGGAITGVVVGRTQKLVLFGEGELNEETVNANTPAQVRSRRDADRVFGDGSELAEGIKNAMSNGANREYVYGVAVEKIADTETVSGSGSGTLSNFPLVEDADVLTVTDSSSGDTLDVNFVYEDAPATPSEGATINVNPFNGAWATDSSSDYEFQYEYTDWETALNSADTVINEDETGIFGTLSEAETVASTLSGKINTLREQFQMVRGVAGAQPNATADDGSAKIETDDYEDAIDNDAMFLYGPTRKANSTHTIGGCVAGLLAGNAVDEPVYNEVLGGVTDLSQRVVKADADNLRDVQVMPVRQMGSIRLRDNLSTATGSGWTKDFWRRRIVDQIILIAKQVGESIFGRINNRDTRSTAEDLIGVEMRSMTRDGLIRPNTGDEDNWYVDVYEDGADQVGIDLGVTPYGIVKRINISITVDA